MATGANITVKKNDGITDIVYTFINPSSGDNVAAIWRSMTVGSAVAHQPELRLAAGNTGKNARKVRGTFMYPQIATNTTTGVVSVINRAFGSFEVVEPRDMAATDINEFASQLANLIASALVKQCLKEGGSAA